MFDIDKKALLIILWPIWISILFSCLLFIKCIIRYSISVKTIPAGFDKIGTYSDKNIFNAKVGDKYVIKCKEEKFNGKNKDKIINMCMNNKLNNNWSTRIKIDGMYKTIYEASYFQCEIYGIIHKTIGKTNYFYAKYCRASMPFTIHSFDMDIYINKSELEIKKNQGISLKEYDNFKNIKKYLNKNSVSEIYNKFNNINVAGIKYIQDIENILSNLSVGSLVLLSKETTNDYDVNAIAVSDIEGKKFGYIPRTNNIEVGKYMQEDYAFAEICYIAKPYYVRIDI